MVGEGENSLNYPAAPSARSFSVMSAILLWPWWSRSGTPCGIS